MSRVIIAVLIMAVVTYIPRVLPIAVFRSKLKSRFLSSFLYYVPFAVLGAMIFPEILYSTGNYYSAITGMIIALILAYFERGLMTVAIGGIVAVFLCEYIMKLY